MSKKANNKELTFSIVYILVVVVLLFMISSGSNDIKLFNSLHKIIVTSKDNFMISNGVNSFGKIALTKRNEYEKEITEINLNSMDKLEISKITGTVANENYIRAVNISNCTPLDINTSKIIVNYCNILDLPPSIVLALMDLESNFNQYAVGSNNDRGYLQIIPQTEEWLATSYGHLLDLEYSPDRIFEPEYNIGLGMLYLYILKRAYGEDYHKILSEYNRGYFNLKKYYKENLTYVTSYSRGVLSRETKFKALN